MGNPRSTRQRKRRGGGLQAHELAILTGEKQPGQKRFALIALAVGAVSTATRPEAIDRIERHLDLAPPERQPLIERWIAFWRGDAERPEGPILENAVHDGCRNVADSSEPGHVPL